MAKQPYIPLYIGDWEQDTNCLSPVAEFALLKLTFKLFKAEKKGVYDTNLRSLNILFKVENKQKTVEILSELIENEVLIIDVLANDLVTIKSRRMMREANISEIRSEIGSTGGRGHKSKAKAKLKQNESKPKAKPKQNTDIEYENDIENVGDIEAENTVPEKDEMTLIFERWVKYKKDRGEKYKTKDSLNTAFEKLKRFSKEDLVLARKIIDDAIGNNYAGFFEPKQVVQLSGQALQSKSEAAFNSHLNFMQKRHG